MRHKNTNDEIQQSSLLLVSKLLCVFLFLTFHNNYSQIFISEGAYLYSENEGLVSHTDSLISNYAKSKIYTSSGVEITHLDTPRNYEVIELTISENRKNEPKKQSALRKELEKNKVKKFVAKKQHSPLDKHFVSTQKSEVHFSFAASFSKNNVLNSDTKAKQIIYSESKIAIAYVHRKLQCNYRDENAIFLSHQSNFQIRPPPFFLQANFL